MEIREFQRLMKEIYGQNDNARGTEKTYLWFFEETGELAEALRKQDKGQIAHEMADVFAWMVSIANMLDIDVEDACLSKYPLKCPRCGGNPCTCGH
jgi:NTP pyrophosphatase (non-canonical NTP hydrolase)